jgi:long-chain acyl-CoA synthetase
VEVGHVGAPIACAEIKLMDVVDMKYFSKNDQGEIAIKGAHISSGYYKDDVKTQEDYRGGWFFTGDVGQWNSNGTLSIIDRKKNIFKLSQGEYIAAEKIEGRS